MDLNMFRRIVDGAAPGIAACNGNLDAQYDYVGLKRGSNYSSTAEVSEALYAQIRDSFTVGLSAVWRICETLRKDLIREHVLYGVPLAPYFEVLRHIMDAVRAPDSPGAPIDADWSKAIQSAFDHAQIRPFGFDPERTYARDFMVARAARYLREAGFGIHIQPGVLRLEEAAEEALVVAIEELIITIGGLNVARRIFAAISSVYDVDQQRYHLVRHVSMTGGGQSQIPWGYLVQLSAKHLRGRKPYQNNEQQWHKLCGLSQAYAAIIDVQPYSPNFWVKLDAGALLRQLQEMAVYDTLFRIPQLRPSDVTRIARGMFGWLDMQMPTTAGYSISQVLNIVEYLLSSTRDVRGPIIINEIDVIRACPTISSNIVTQILEEVLSHPLAGANRNFSRPTDAPLPDDPNLKNAGHDFFFRPLLRHSSRQFVLLDRSVCAPAFLEALMGCLRSTTKRLDEKIGASIERFLAMEFSSHGVGVTGGDYDIDGVHGECDIVVDAYDVVVLAEMKKKSLTRRARAGHDAHLLLDLAGSLLAAQAQAGWHEVRLRHHDYLELERDGITSRVELKGRGIERIAVSLLDYGSLQDRIVLTQFLETNMNVTFTPSDPRLSDDFNKINDTLKEIRDQLVALYPGATEVEQPFFHCWFLSVPQILILLDGVTDGAAFKKALWECRHIVTGSSDLYFDLAYMKKLHRQVASEGI